MSGRGKRMWQRPKEEARGHNSEETRRSNKRKNTVYCPQCLKGFKTDDLYKAHYKQEHSKK